MLPHIMRTNFLCRQDKSYISTHLVLPPLAKNGWIFENDKWTPVKSLSPPPTPQAVSELVKCNCQHEYKKNCSSEINSLCCTALCKCYSAGCIHFADYQVHNEDEDEEEFD